ncbi:HU family DNA-binding protein [Patescibacteria group bacterium]|nr:HU family DNA-binding protein [Patescibacteria group bacterium]MBU1931340.1 HU family DNA-binding protein [Patescibacteria group bacterium]
MTKLELIDIIAKKAHLTKKAAREAVEALLGEVNRALNKGEKVVLSGFGTFKVVKVKDKKGRNPQTGDNLVIKGHKAVRFVVGKPLKQAVK